MAKHKVYTEESDIKAVAKKRIKRISKNYVGHHTDDVLGQKFNLWCSACGWPMEHFRDYGQFDVVTCTNPDCVLNIREGPIRHARSLDIPLTVNTNRYWSLKEEGRRF